MPTSPAPPPTDVDEAADRLGIEQLRPAQRQAIGALLDGRDALVVLPTGAGKSAIYQVAGALLDGPTVVVSPLISLQEDQRAALADARLGEAEALHSLLTEADQAAVLDGVAGGTIRYLFLAPEQLLDEDVLGRLAAARPGLVVVDEAHLVTAWGDGFRPAFLAIGLLTTRLGRPPVLALTASASPPVRTELDQRLGLADPEVVVAGVERPNIHLGASRVDDEADVPGALAGLAADLDGTGLVYVARRKDAEHLARVLGRPTRPALAYHGGLGRSARIAVHERFGSDEPCVVVATSAFGLGIDKPDVRFVLHAEPPETVDAWYQEVGRAGRDGAPATARLLSIAGARSRRAFAAGARSSSPALAARVHAALETAPAPLPLAVATRGTRASLARAMQAVQDLDAVGAVRVTAAGLLVEPHGPRGADLLAALEGRAAQRRDRRRTEARVLEQVLEGAACLWQAICGYLGDPRSERCGHCDRCDETAREPDAGGSPAEGAVASSRAPAYAPGARLKHREFGAGTVIEHHDDVIMVAFEEAGYRSLAVELLEDGDLLEEAGG
ncbi:MAG: RecQ family ATP-dependent DNA helicase [Actinobacteria bacterium]|nr:RecQ family ATP-dependent DNA helicase [Actinomycetota bacterium]